MHYYYNRLSLIEKTRRSQSRKTCSIWCNADCSYIVRRCSRI